MGGAMRPPSAASSSCSRRVPTGALDPAAVDRLQRDTGLARAAAALLLATLPAIDD